VKSSSPYIRNIFNIAAIIKAHNKTPGPARIKTLINTLLKINLKNKFKKFNLPVAIEG
jgi:hypothetical protein